MTKVQVHKLDKNDGHIHEYYDDIITDIDTDERVMHLFGLQFGLGMTKIRDGVWSTQYGELFTVIRERHDLYNS